jgi:drug/metabolite transporter (DMT)-like permease
LREKEAEPVKNLPAKNLFLLFLAALIWGSAFVAQAVGMDHLGPFAFNASRSLVGGVALLPVIAIFDRFKSPERRQEEKANRKTLLLGGICCGVALCVASNLQQVGIQYTTVGKAGFITALYIVIVPILGLFFRRKVGAKLWVSVAIAIVGLYLLCMSGSLSLGLGDILVLLCALGFSVHIMVIDHFSPMVDGVKLSCIQFFVAGVLSLVVMLFTEGVPAGGDILLSWAPILYAGVLSSGVAYTLQIVGQKGVNPTVASLVLSLESVFSVLSGWIVLHQSMSLRESLGCVLMFAAIILAQLPERTKKDSAGDAALQ